MRLGGELPPQCDTCAGYIALLNELPAALRGGGWKTHAELEAFAIIQEGKLGQYQGYQIATYEWTGDDSVKFQFSHCKERDVGETVDQAIKQ